MLQMMREWLRYLKWILVLVIFSFLWWGADTWVGGGSVGPQTGWAAPCVALSASRAEMLRLP